MLDPVSGNPREKGPIMTMRLLLELLLAASDISGYPVAPTLPRVEVAAPASMPCRCLGAYQDGVVWISSDLDPRTPFGRSVVLHEIVHHLQEQSRGAPRDTQARARLEREALGAQNAYLAAQGSRHRAAYVTDDE